MRFFPFLTGPRLVQGMSLVETMVCLLIAATLVSLAGPAFRDMLVRQRIAAARSELTTAMQWARWEAVRRNAPVALQRRTGCGELLSSANDWDCGWDVQTTLSGSAQTLQTFVLPPGLRLSHPGGGAALEFGRTGMPTLVAHKFVIGASADVTPSTTVLCINRTGRVRTATGTATC